MKKLISTTIAAMTLVGTLACSAQALDIDFDFSNVLIKHRQFILTDDSSLTEFLIVNYTDEDKLMSASDEMHFNKEEYDLNYFETLDPDTIFDGFTETDSNKYIVEDAADFYRVIFYFGDLDDSANLKIAVDCGFIITESEITDGSFMLASSICDNALASGGKEIPTADIGNYDLKFNID